MNDLIERGREAARAMRAMLEPIGERVQEEHRPFLVALLERNAAKRYRGWAEEASDAAERDGLLACADREERIAAAIEAMSPDAGSLQTIQEGFAPHVPDLRRVQEEVFGEKDRLEQMAIQAAAERIGAELWLTLAADTADPGIAEMLRGCAALEEESGAYLDRLLAELADA